MIPPLWNYDLLRQTATECGPLNCEVANSALKKRHKSTFFRSIFKLSVRLLIRLFRRFPRKSSWKMAFIVMRSEHVNLFMQWLRRNSERWSGIEKHRVYAIEYKTEQKTLHLATTRRCRSLFIPRCPEPLISAFQFAVVFGF